jgi:death-on-curing protein
VNEPEWVTMPIVLAIHDEQLAIHGGSAGLRVAALL